MLSPQSGGLDATDRQLVVAVMERVDPDVARLQLLDRAVGFDKIACPDGGAETVHAVVRLFDRFVQVVELEDRQDRPNLRLAHDSRVPRRILDKRWQIEVAARETVAFWTRSSDGDLCA